MKKTQNSITTILFDFDGTIADTFTEVVRIYNNIATSLHCKPVEEKDIPRLRNTRPQDFMGEYNISNLRLPVLVIKGRRLLMKKIHEIEPFDHIVEVLEELKSYGFHLGILSSNSQKNIRKFLETNGIDHLFDSIHNGKNLFGKSKKIVKIMKQMDLKSSQLLLIGDETRDIEAAHKLNVAIVAVSWGFNEREVLQKLQPNDIADTPRELLSHIKNIAKC